MPARKRRSLPDVARTFQTYLYHRDAAAIATKEKEKAAKDLRKFTRERGVVVLDEYDNEIHGGNIEYALDDPIQVGAKVYTGMELRKSPQISFDEDAALALVERKKIPLADVVGDVTITLSYRQYERLKQVLGNDPRYEEFANVDFAVNQDAFYVLNQQGTVTDTELDSLLVEGEPRYAFWPIEESAE